MGVEYPYPVMIDLPISVLISLASLIAGMAGSWAVTRNKAQLGASEIKDLRETLHEMQLVMAGWAENLKSLSEKVSSLESAMNPVTNSHSPQIRRRKRS